jgi:hypothetical protein
MAIGDGIRRNVATISQAEKYRFMQAILALDAIKFYGDGVSYWDKQEDIHKDAHAGGADVHGGPAFIPWHREICNRFEALLREVDPALSLHYWDWTTDPRTVLLKPEFMGSGIGDAGFPLQNFESTEGGGHTRIWRNITALGAPGVSSDNTIVTTGNTAAQANQFPQMRAALQGAHNTAHGYIGGSIGQAHFSFHDPFVFLLHSNVDRLWARWQTAAGQAWRLDPNQVYGNDGTAASITGNLEPWDGSTGLRPWAPPENQQVAKNCKHPSVVTPPLYDFSANEQSDWRWCHKCQGMFFGGNPGSVCPAGGAHDSTGSGNYSLVQNTSAAHGQANWRWCNKCQGLFFAGNPGSRCPAGGAHVQVGSGNYCLVQNIPLVLQDRWRWCRTCQGLFFGGNPGSDCPAGGPHDSTGSGNYSLWRNAPAAHGQANWRWCNKCQGLFFAGNPGGRCPVGGAHSQTGSGNYTLVDSIPAAPGQSNWRWCNKCQGLFFAGNPGSQCPAGGTHVQVGSGNYTLLHNVQTSDQSNWRWCRKCQGLFFGGNAGSRCPEGDEHDRSGSGDYNLRRV